jgi:hypothetical protein
MSETKGEKSKQQQHQQARRGAKRNVRQYNDALQM